METVSVLGWNVVCASSKDFAQQMLLDCIDKKNDKQKPKLAFSLNAQALSLAEFSSDFSGHMKCADYIQADGQSLVFASILLSEKKLPERIATTDFFHDAADCAQDNQLNFYLLGAKPDEIDLAVKNVKKIYPKLNIVGYRDGYFSSSEELEICEEIVKLKTDVLWVGLGKPGEQYFCCRNIDNLVGVRWIKTCGGLFDFLAGKYPRAPLWMQKSGLEWFFRFLVSPKRLGWRYLLTNLHSIYIFMKFFVKKLVAR